VLGIGNQLMYKYPLIIEITNNGKYLKKIPPIPMYERDFISIINTIKFHQYLRF
jgi:hypothetical protein